MIRSWTPPLVLESNKERRSRVMTDAVRQYGRRDAKRPPADEDEDQARGIPAQK